MCVYSAFDAIIARPHSAQECHPDVRQVNISAVRWNAHHYAATTHDKEKYTEMMTCHLHKVEYWKKKYV